MPPDPLTQLLRAADRTASSPPTAPADLPERIRQLARQRRRNLYRHSALAVALLAGLSIFLRPSGSSTPEYAHVPTTDRTPDATALRMELLAIRAEAEALRAEVLAARPAPARTHVRPAVTMDTVDDELERAAYLIVYQADRYHRELDLPKLAIASYRQTIDLFPKTRAAQTARDRLTELETPKGHES